MEQQRRYCSNCGQRLLQEDRFCAGCGRLAHETTRVPTPEADVPVAQPPRQGFWAEETPPGRSRWFGQYTFWVLVLPIPALLVLFVGMLLVLAALGYSGGETGRILAQVLTFGFFGLLGLLGLGVLWIAVRVVLNVIRHARDMMR